jgi:hypothetical protein
MRSIVAKATVVAIVLVVAAAGADAQTQTRHRRAHEPRDVEQRAIPAAPTDKRDSVVAAVGAFNGRPYWLALAQCGGIHFKLNIFYTDAAVHARVGKPDPRAVTEYTKELKQAIKTATIYFDGAERFLMTDRGIERVDAVLTYDPQSRAAGDRLKTLDAALAAAQICPALYQACQAAYPKACSEPLSPTS